MMAIVGILVHITVRAVDQIWRNIFALHLLKLVFRDMDNRQKSGRCALVN